MPRAMLLARPIRHAVLAIRGKRCGISKRAMSATTESHLDGHELTESKAAIQKHSMAANAVEVIVSSDKYPLLPVGKSADCDAAWSPDVDAFGSDRFWLATNSAMEILLPRSAFQEGFPQ
jgi:hypothetical protein